MNNNAAVEAWDAAAAELSDFVAANKRQPSSQDPAEKHLYDWGLRQISRMNRGMLSDRQEQNIAAILDLYESVVDLYPSKTPSLDAAEQFYARHGRLPSAEAGGEEAETAKILKGYIRACRYRDGFRADALTRLLALPGAIPEEELASYQRALHILANYRRPMAQSAEGMSINGIRLNPAARLKRVPATTRIKSNQELKYADKWNSVFAEFTAWVTEHGSLPRRRSTDPQEKRLANWLNVQRRNHRENEIPEPLEATLATVPGALEPAAFKTAGQWYEQIAAFLTEHGRLPSCSAESGTPERSMAEYVAGRLRPALRNGTVQQADSPALAAIKAELRPFRGEVAA